MANKRGLAGRIWGNVADAFIPGDAYNDVTGTWNPMTTKVGIAGLLAGQLAPGGSLAVQGLAKGGVFGDSVQQGLQNEGYRNDLAYDYGDYKERMGDTLGQLQTDVPALNPGLKGIAQMGWQVGQATPSLSPDSPFAWNGQTSYQPMEPFQSQQAAQSNDPFAWNGGAGAPGLGQVASRGAFGGRTIAQGDGARSMAGGLRDAANAGLMREVAGRLHGRQRA